MFLEKNVLTEGIALRVTPTAPVGQKKSRKLSPVDIINCHAEVAETKGCVVFSTNLPIDIIKHPHIEKVFLFSTSTDHHFLIEAVLQEIFTSDEEFVPTTISEDIQVPEWLNEPKKNWLILSDFKKIDIDSCPLKLTNRDALLREQIFVPRFSTCYVSLD